jgi:hypothetical protein
VIVSCRGIRHFPLLLFVAVLLLLLQGCASPSWIIVQPDQSKTVFEQHFQQAYGGRTDDGTYEFLLIADDADSAAAQNKPGAALHPVAREPLRQVIYIKVLWRPMPGAQTTAANNAAITWYVMSDAPQNQRDLLEYRGTAFVAVRPKDHSARVRISNGTVLLHSRRGHLRDAIGQGHLSGEFTAVSDDSRLEEILASTRARSTTLASAEK